MKPNAKLTFTTERKERLCIKGNQRTLQEPLFARFGPQVTYLWKFDLNRGSFASIYYSYTENVVRSVFLCRWPCIDHLSSHLTFCLPIKKLVHARQLDSLPPLLQQSTNPIKYKGKKIDKNNNNLIIQTIGYLLCIE